MWLLIQINDINDIGQHEKERILIHDTDIHIEKTHPLELNITAKGTSVHPNTMDMEKATPYKIRTYLINHGWIEQPFKNENLARFTNHIGLTPIDILAPATTNLIDSRHIVELVLDTLSLFENRSAYEIFVDISKQVTTFKWNNTWEDGKIHEETGDAQYFMRMCHCGKRRGQHTGKTRLERDAKCPEDNIKET